MKKNNFILVFLITLCFSCGFGPSKKSENNRTITERPNIIFLLTDDQRADALGFTGYPNIQTPNLDSLAGKGTYFNNAYVTTSICAVSRASILTGQYARKHGIWGFSTDFTNEQLQNTYPLLLRKNGYTTGFIGKYGVGHQLPEKHFDYWKGFPGQGTFKQTDPSGNPIHLTQKIGNQALEFLDIQKQNKKPFCLSVSFKAPHVEGDPGYFLPDEAYSEMLENETVPVPFASKPEFFDYFPEKFTRNNVARNRWKDRFATPEMQQENIKKYYRLIHGIDVVVGKILETLKKNGQDKNTIIIFSSDNGFYLGEYGFAGKWYGSDPSIRVPLLIFHPSDPDFRSKKIAEKALNIDIAPTILGFAGITPPETMQGENLIPLVKNPDINWRNSFFYEHLWQSSPAYYIPSTEGVVDQNYKYMTYFKDRDTSSTIFEELYDLSKDPYEINNLAGKTEYLNIQRKMEDKLDSLKREAGK